MLRFMLHSIFWDDKNVLLHCEAIKYMLLMYGHFNVGGTIKLKNTFLHETSKIS